VEHPKSIVIRMPTFGPVGLLHHGLSDLRRGGFDAEFLLQGLRLQWSLLETQT
jgi:hypothetical protein